MLRGLIASNFGRRNCVSILHRQHICTQKTIKARAPDSIQKSTLKRSINSYARGNSYKQAHDGQKSSQYSSAQYFGIFMSGSMFSYSLRCFLNSSFDEQSGIKRGTLYARGEQRYENGDVYTGELKGGLRHGRGKYTCANGDVYEGGFADDEADDGDFRAYSRRR